MLSTILTKSFSKDTALLILRVITGTGLIHHGYEKLANIENFADAFVRPLHLPFPIFLSYIAAFSEIGGSWLLIIGLATRFGALAIVGTISVAIYHGVGENYDFITEFKNLHHKKIFNLVRDEDLFAWKFAKKGFFKFKENIPKINQRILENYSKNNF